MQKKPINNPTINRMNLYVSLTVLTPLAFLIGYCMGYGYKSMKPSNFIIEFNLDAVPPKQYLLSRSLTKDRNICTYRCTNEQFADILQDCPKSSIIEVVQNPPISYE